MIRWLKNFIGRFKGYSWCVHCRDTWNWKKAKHIDFNKTEGIFALCEECFNKLTFLQVVFYYERLFNNCIRDNLIYYTRSVINKERKILIKNIKKEKENEED